MVLVAAFLTLLCCLHFRASDGRWVALSRLLLAIAVLQGSFGMTGLLLPEEAGLDLRQRIARATFIIPAAFFIGLLAYVAHRLPRELGQARRKAMAEGREALRAEAEPGQAEALWLKAERSARDAGIEPPTRDYLRWLITSGGEVRISSGPESALPAKESRERLSRAISSQPSRARTNPGGKRTNEKARIRAGRRDS